MNTVTSKDGTPIAFDKSGQGPVVILVMGAFSYRKYPGAVELAERLSSDFTVINYDRRGRGDSGDTAPYAVEREIEDLEALIKEAGGSAFVWGMSSGAVLALKAASRGLPIRKLVLFEPPYAVDQSGTLPPTDFVAHLKTLMASDKRGEAVRYFMTKGMGAPGFVVTMMRFMPGVWARLKAVANTLPYDAMMIADHTPGQPLKAETWAHMTIPTMVMSGSKSAPSLRSAARNLAQVLSNVQEHVLEGVSHTNPDMKVIAPASKDFFKA